MAKKRYYAVKVGKKKGIYESWDECSKQVKGYPGAEYKGFVTRKEAYNHGKGKEKDRAEKKTQSPINSHKIHMMFELYHM